MVSSATVRLSEYSSLESYGNINHKAKHGYNGSAYGQSLKDTAENDRFEGLVGLTGYDLRGLLLVLMRNSTRF